MRKRILKCIAREVIIKEADLIAKLKEDSLILPSNWIPKRIVKAKAAIINHPLLIRAYLRKLLADKAVACNHGNYTMTLTGHTELGHPAPRQVWHFDNRMHNPAPYAKRP